MAVRTELGWPGRLLAGGLIALALGAVAWWGIDVGQLIGGLDRPALEARLGSLAADLDAARREAAALESSNARLTSELAVLAGVQRTLQQQQAELLQENGSLKDEITFLKSFFTDARPAAALAIPKLSVEGHGDVRRFSVLMVRGAGAKGEFEGRLELLADLVPGPDAPQGSTPYAMPVPPPGATAPLRLQFKHYQRVDGTLHVPTGYVLRAVTVRAYESGVAAPRTTRSLMLP